MTSTAYARTSGKCLIGQYMLQCVLFTSLIFSVPVYTLLLVSFGSYRILIWIIVKLCFSNKLQLMSGSDALHMNGSNPDVEGGYMPAMPLLCVFKGNMNLELFQKGVASSYMHANPGDKHDFQLTRSPKRLFGIWFWKSAVTNPLDFDMRNHITTFEGIRDNNTVLTDDKVREWISSNFYTRFGKDTPNWHLYFIPHFGYKNQEIVSSPEHLWAFILRCHHCYADGMRVLQNIILKMANENPVQFFPPQPQNNAIQKIMKIMKIILAFAYLPVLITHSSYVPRNPLHGPHTNGKKNCLWTKIFHVDVLKNIRVLTNASITAITIAALSETVNEYFSKKMPKSDFKNVSISVPLPTKYIERRDKRLGNNVTMTYFDLPTGKMPILKRLDIIQDSLTNHRSKTIQSCIELAMYLQGVIPFQIQQKLLPKETPLSVCYSNIPGPITCPLQFLGENTIVESAAWIVPICNIGVGLAVISFSGRVRLNASIDTAINPTEAQDFIDSVLNNIYKLQSEALNAHEKVA